MRQELRIDSVGEERRTLWNCCRSAGTTTGIYCTNCSCTSTERPLEEVSGWQTLTGIFFSNTKNYQWLYAIAIGSYKCCLATTTWKEVIFANCLLVGCSSIHSGLVSNLCLKSWLFICLKSQRWYKISGKSGSRQNGLAPGKEDTFSGGKHPWVIQVSRFAPTTTEERAAIIKDWVIYNELVS